MIDYNWMLANSTSAAQVKNEWKNNNLKGMLYNFISLCKIGYTDEELRSFIDGLLQDVPKEKENQ